MNNFDESQVEKAIFLPATSKTKRIYFCVLLMKDGSCLKGTHKEPIGSEVSREQAETLSYRNACGQADAEIPDRLDPATPYTKEFVVRVNITTVRVERCTPKLAAALRNLADIIEKPESYSETTFALPCGTEATVSV